MALARGEVAQLVRMKRWMQDRGDAPLTNTLMGGGRLYVPCADYPEFLRAYAADVAAGVSHYVIERCSTRCRWFADVDMKGRALDEAEWVRIAQALQQRLHALAAQSGTLVVLKANGDGKTGLHFVAPEICTEVETMLRWHASLVDALTEACDSVDWTDALDAAVYKGGGSLRMVGSRKMVPCRRTDHDATCCHGTGRIDAGRPYELFFCLDRAGRRDTASERAFRANTALLVHRSSIRRPSPVGARPAARPPARSSAQACRKRAKRGGSGAGVEGDALVDVVQGVPVEHAKLRVVRMTPVGDSQFYARVAGEGQHFCPVVGREHTTSTVYYFVDEANAVAWLQCFCRKGSCEKARTGPFALARHHAKAQERQERPVATDTDTRIRTGLPPGFSNSTLPSRQV